MLRSWFLQYISCSRAWEGDITSKQTQIPVDPFPPARVHLPGAAAAPHANQGAGTTASGERGAANQAQIHCAKEQWGENKSRMRSEGRGGQGGRSIGMPAKGPLCSEGMDVKISDAGRHRGTCQGEV